MNILHMAWLLGRPTSASRIPQLLTVGAYTMVSAMVLIVLGGAWSFTKLDGEAQSFYVPLAAFALVLLIVPLLVLGSSAAKLSARAQDRALSSLRLLGATGFQVRAVAVTQAAVTALVGALAGVLLYLALAPAVALVPFQGQAIGTGIFLPAGAAALAVVAVVLLSVISALAGLRKLVITPLAVATRRVAPVPSWLRAVITVGSIVVLYSLFTNVGLLPVDLGVLIAIIIGGFALGLLALNLIGPWLVAKVGKSKLNKANNAEQLLAARMILESPVAAWRQVSGVAMASFVAVIGGTGAAMFGFGEAQATGTWEDYLGTDVLTGVLVTLGLALICVAISAAISQCAGTLDREELYSGLGKLGMDLAVINAARVKSLMIPALTVAIGFAVASVVLVLPFASLALLMKPLTVGTVLVVLVAGLLMIRVSLNIADPRRLLLAGSRRD
ncbi:permease [Arthrobacter sp. MYb224]|uniref:FtsX-like permease family protein n=1 Tax=Arthrobacter sp. MYb224 TaxID=1848600 RepID=UPI000CFB6290|nr:FtsX-like permease family protein [Arthrobacter sp. MYb224]PQZ96895.1 permease [Arthrobacter sp. MYb224]